MFFRYKRITLDYNPRTKQILEEKKMTHIAQRQWKQLSSWGKDRIKDDLCNKLA